MSYDFITEMSLIDDYSLINQVVFGKEGYSILESAPWTVKGQILASGLFYFEKEIKKRYSAILQKPSAKLPASLKETFIPSQDILNHLPCGTCLMKADLELETPFHSRDDLSFYPTENLLKRDHVFHVPYLSAAGIKGLLRWAWRMCYEDQYEEDLEKIIFGPRPGSSDEDSAFQGVLYTWPLFWDGRIGEDIINPQDRKKNIGTVPIKYEVVESGATASLYLMLVKRPGVREKWPEIVSRLLDVVEFLLNNSGLSAKRTSDWGRVKILSTKAWILRIEEPAGESEDKAQKEEKTALLWKQVCDENGNLLPMEDKRITKELLMTLTGKTKKYCSGKKKAKAYESLKRKYKDYLEAKAAEAERQKGLKQEREVKSATLQCFTNFLKKDSTFLAAFKSQEAGK